MKPEQQKKPVAQQQNRWSVTLLGVMLVVLVVPYVSALDKSKGDSVATNNLTQKSPISEPTSVNFSTIIVGQEKAATTIDINNSMMGSDNKTASIQARVASNYLASRAATGLQLKHKSSANKPANAMNLMGDTVGLETAIDSLMDLQTAAGEHKKYILVKKKPKHKKIKMEIYKPKMKYKKIKMKIPVKKMKKKKVKGYLVKKEKHHHY